MMLAALWEVAVENMGKRASADALPVLVQRLIKQVSARKGK